MLGVVTTSTTKDSQPDDSFHLLSPLTLTNNTSLWQLDNREPWVSSTPPGSHKFSSSTMSNRTSLDNPTSLNGGGRWMMNTTGQLIDTDSAAAEWELADEIVNLKISNGADDGPLRTPPQTKLPSSVPPIEETSPLSSSGDSSENPATSHSRDSSLSVASNLDPPMPSSAQKNRGAIAPLKLDTSDPKERPHSFSGGLSTADLRRLQIAGDEPLVAHGHQPWMSAYPRDGAYERPFEQLSYPTPTQQQPSRSQQHTPQQSWDGQTAGTGAPINGDDVRVSYETAPKGFSGLNAGQAGANGASQDFQTNRVNWRQQRNFAPQTVVHSPPPATGYPTVQPQTLGNAQQVYEMMMPALHDPAVARVQQQHNVFRAPQSNNSDHSIRDPASLGMMNTGVNMQYTPGAGMYQPQMTPLPHGMSAYPTQFYPAPEGYPAGVQMARIQSPYTNQFAMVPQVVVDGQVQPPGTAPLQSPNQSANANGPSANNRKLGLYKTELCRSWEEKGTCRYGGKCQFAHGEEELRRVARHPKYKTEICRTFWVSGSCPYGKRCCFIHTDVPQDGVPPGADGTPPPPGDNTNGHGRSRSVSTNSDPNDSSNSLLARIARKKEEASNNAAGNSTNSSNTPTVEQAPSPANHPYSNGRPGSLRVDTSSLDKASAKQNKSAYPTFASNARFIPAPDHGGSKSPIPLTAGPDLGRHNNARAEIVGYSQSPQQRLSTSTNNRRSLSGADIELNFNSSANPRQSPPFIRASPDNGNVTPIHSRSGSGGNWGMYGRNNPAPSGNSENNGTANSPWSTTDLKGASRLSEKGWV